MTRRHGTTGHRRVRLATAVGTRLITAVPFFEEELRLLPALVPRGGTCIDIGAAYGIYAMAMAAAAGPLGTVLAFEPQRLPRRTMTAFRRLLGVSAAVQVQSTALTDADGEKAMVVPYRHRVPVTGRAFVATAAGWEAPEEFPFVRRRPVRTRALDAVVDELALDRVDVVKIDVEGGELRALAGAQRALAAFRPALIVEIEQRHTVRYGHSAESVFTWLAGQGYRCAVYRDGRLQPTPGALDGVRNYVFLHHEDEHVDGMAGLRLDGGGPDPASPSGPPS